MKMVASLPVTVVEVVTTELRSKVYISPNNDYVHEITSESIMYNFECYISTYPLSNHINILRPKGSGGNLHARAG